MIKNLMPRIVCKDAHHEERFRAAYKSMAPDRQSSTEWLAALYVLTWLSVWDWIERHVDHDRGEIRWHNLRQPAIDHDEFILFSLANNLYNGDGQSELLDLMDLTPAMFDVALGALQIRRFGIRVLPWLTAGTPGLVAGQ